MVFHKLDQDSANSISSALSIFSTPPTNVTVSSSTYKEILTLNPFNSYPFHFRIVPGSDYLDLSECVILTEMKIQYKNDAGDYVPPPPNAKVASIQGVGSTFIRQLRISINGRETFNANSLYSYKAYLDTELSYSAEVKNSFLSVAGWYNHEDSQTDADDVGFKARQSLFAAGHTAQFITRLHADMFRQPKYVVSNVEVRTL